MNMLLQYFLFYIFCFLSGRSLYIILGNFNSEQVEDEEVFNLKSSSLFTIYGLFFLGNTIVIFNFFTPLNLSTKIIICLILVLPNLAKLKIKYQLKENLRKTALKITTATVLSVSFFDIGISKDSYLYHIKNQLWIIQDKIIFGISNLDPYLGYLPISEYIHSFIFTLENYKYIHFFNLTIVISFTFILIEMFFCRNKFLINSAFIISIFGFLDNFGFQGGRNGYFYFQELGKTDSSAGIIFTIFTIFIVCSFQLQRPVNKNEVITLLLFSIFSIQMRPIGYLSLFLIGCLLYKSDKRTRYYFLNIKLLIFFLIWHIKSVVTTSCFIYPVSFTCLPFLSWHTTDLYSYLSKLILAGYWNPQIGIRALENFDWIIDPWFIKNKSYLINFFFTLFIIFMINRFRSFKYNKNVFFIFFSVFVFLIWFLAFPQYRFTASVFIPGTILFFNYELSNTNKIFEYFRTRSLLIYFLIVINSVMLVNRNSYIEMINSQKIFSAPVEVKKYFERSGGYWDSPVEVVCGANKNCYYWDYEVISDEIKSYKIFKLKDPSYYSFLLEKNIEPTTPIVENK